MDPTKVRKALLCCQKKNYYNGMSAMDISAVTDVESSFLEGEVFEEKHYTLVFVRKEKSKEILLGLKVGDSSLFLFLFRKYSSYRHQHAASSHPRLSHSCEVLERANGMDSVER